VSSGQITVGTQLLTRPDVLDERPDLPEGPHAGPLSPWVWDEMAPGQDGTLLAVVPIPGTGTSLAIVGYPIASADRAAGAPASAGPSDKRGAVSGLLLDHAQRRVWAGEREVPLTFQEFELLAFLSEHPATVFSRADLVEHVWRRNPGRDARAVARDSRTVDVHVSRVRQKLGPRYGQCLVTEYRVGYQFRPLPS